MFAFFRLRFLVYGFVLDRWCCIVFVVCVASCACVALRACGHRFALLFVLLFFTDYVAIEMYNQIAFAVL